MPQRVLVVDDEECLARALLLFLEKSGYRVDVCHSARAARALLERVGPVFDLAVVDQQIGKESGTKLADFLLQRIPSLRVVLMSGLPLEAEELPECAPGQVVFLQKPFRPADMARCLGNLSASRVLS